MDLLFLAALFLVMWFLLIRPQQARVRRQRELVRSVGVGDEIVTVGGVVGTVTVLGDDELRLEVSPGIELRVLRGAVSGRLSPSAVAEAEPDTDVAQDEPGEDR